MPDKENGKIAVRPKGAGTMLRPQTLAEAMQFATIIAKTEMIPKQFRNKPNDVMVAIQMGSEVGLPPMQALQNIAVINGRPSLWGDAIPAIIKSHPAFVDMIETFDEKTETARCVVKRNGCTDVIQTFSWADAEKAHLHTKDTYKQYPRRMLQMRARAFACRDQFPDAMRGMGVAEEVRDYEVRDITPRELPNDAPLGEILEAIAKAVNEQELQTVIFAASNLENEDEKAKVKTAYKEKANELREVPEEGKTSFGSKKQQEAPKEKEETKAEAKEQEQEAEPPHNPVTGEVVEPGKYDNVGPPAMTSGKQQGLGW